MTPKQLRAFRQRIGMTQLEFADYLGVASNTLARWERSELNMRPATALLIEKLIQDTDLTNPVLPKLPSKGKEK
jgi:transcriptional regulator with XRE-family HTH domain